MICLSNFLHLAGFQRPYNICEKHLLIHTKTGNMCIQCKAFMCRPKSRFCDFCEQVLSISPGFKDHTKFHKYSLQILSLHLLCCVNAKLPCFMLDQHCFTEKFTHVYSKKFVTCVSKFLQFAQVSRIIWLFMR